MVSNDLFCVFRREFRKDVLFFKPVRINADLFQSVAFLPDPTPGEENHYQDFSNVYRTKTSEQFRPSFQMKKKKLPNSPTLASPGCSDWGGRIERRRRETFRGCLGVCPPEKNFICRVSKTLFRTFSGKFYDHLTATHQRFLL